MKIPEALKTTTAQHAFEVALVILLLLVLPMLGPYLGKYGGGTAMLVTSIVGLVIFCCLSDHSILSDSARADGRICNKNEGVRKIGRA